MKLQVPSSIKLRVVNVNLNLTVYPSVSKWVNERFFFTGGGGRLSKTLCTDGGGGVVYPKLYVQTAVYRVLPIHSRQFFSWEFIVCCGLCNKVEDLLHFTSTVRLHNIPAAVHGPVEVTVHGLLNLRLVEPYHFVEFCFRQTAAPFSFLDWGYKQWWDFD